MKKHILRLLAALMALTIIMTGSVGAFAEDMQTVELTEEQIAELTAAEEIPAEEAEAAVEAEEAPAPEVTEEPVPEITGEPAPEATEEPAPEVTEEPVPEVTGEPIPEVTEESVPEVTEEPVPEVTEEPVPEVTAGPSAEPSAEPTAEPELLPQTAQELADCFGFELWEIAEAFELTEEELIALPAEEIAVLYEQIVEMLGGVATFANEFEISADGTLTKYNGSSETVVIPSTVKKIGTSAFKNNKDIRYVTIPSSVTAIVGGSNSYNTGAFQYCTDLRSVTIEGNNLESIGVDTFDGCTKLSSINIPSSVETIGANAFSGCTSLVSVSLLGAETIGESAFNGCTELESVSLSDVLSSMSQYAFHKTGLKEVTIPGSLKNIPLYAFSTCTDLERVVIESGVETIQSGNTSYNTGAFQNCTSLKEVVIKGNTLEHIGVRTFCGCTKLSSINIPASVEAISTYAFHGCNSLTNIVLPGVETIGESAFSSCPELESVSLPNTLTSMGQYAFQKTALKEVTIPGSLKNIPLYAFSACTDLERVVIESGVETIQSGNTSYNTGAFQNCTSLKEVVIEGNTLEFIGVRTFCGCTKLSSINIPASVETISTYAFHGCNSLTNIVLPGVETIGDSAFSSCPELVSVSLPNTLTSMGEAAFQKTGLKAVTIPGSLKNIPLYAFSACTDLEKVVIESGVEAIQSGSSSYNTGAFQNCTSLKEVIIEGNTLESIGTKTFCGCTDLKNVYLPASVESFGGNVFYGCKNATVWVYANTAAHTYCINNASAQGFSYKLYGSEPTPTPIPTATPTPTPTVKPTATPTTKPTATPTAKPTATPTVKPTATPTPVPDGELYLDGADELTVGKSMTITVTDENGKTVSARSLEWSTSDKSIATVSRGKVTAKKGGFVTITAENEDGLIGYLDITVVPKASSVTIWYDGEEAGSSLGVDISDTDEVQLEAVVNPEDAAQGVTWKSGSTKVAKVDENGLVTFLKAGKATITATAADGSKKSDKITITAGIMAQEIEIIGSNEVAAGKNVTLKAKVYPEKASQDVEWSSSDKSVATVSRGKVTAKKIRNSESVIITATAKDGSGVSAEFEVWVVPAASSVTITIDGENAGSSAILDVSSGDPTLQLDAIINPEDASQSVTWKSSSSKVATVDESGLVTGLKKGKATITATAADGSKKSDKITINVICAAQEIEITGAEELTAGRNTTLKAHVYPEEADQEVKWSSSDRSIATVDSKGKVTAKKVSSAESVIITATAEDGSEVYAEHEILVYPAATKVEILMDGESASSGTLALSDTDGTQLEAIVYPEGASQNVSWKSSNTKIATVDEDGMVTPLRAGKVTITATTANGKSTSFSLTIFEEAPADDALPLLLADVKIGSTNTAKTPDGKLPSGAPKITVSATSSKVTVKHEDTSKSFSYAIDTYSYFDGKLAAIDMGNGEYTFLLMIEEASNFYPGGWYAVFRLNGSSWETLKTFDHETRSDDIHVYASFITSSRFVGEIFPTRTAFTGTMKQSSSSYIGKDLWEGGFGMNYEAAEDGYYNLIFSTYEYPSMNSYNGGGSKTRYVMQGDKLVIDSQWYEIPAYAGTLG